MIDHHPENWQLDLDLLEAFLMNFSMLNEQDELILKKDSRTVRALVLPHLLGGTCDLDRLAFIMRRFHLPWGEDITQALGSRWKERPCGSFGSVNYCRFTENPILPFGEAVIFSTVPGALSEFADKSVTVLPTEVLGNTLGRQLIPNWKSVLRKFRELEDHYRQSISASEISWMGQITDGQSNGLSAAFTSQKDLRPKALPLGRLMPPLYRQSPFDKSLYIRQEDWSGKLFHSAYLLPIHFGRTLVDQYIEELEKLIHE